MSFNLSEEIDLCSSFCKLCLNFLIEFENWKRIGFSLVWTWHSMKNRDFLRHFVVSLQYQCYV